MNIYTKILKKQRGFAMLEVVLAVVIIAIASFGIYKLYSSSSITSKMNDTEGTISQIQSAANQLSYTLSAQPTALQLYSSGILPASLWTEVPTAATGTLGSLFGTITYTGNTTYASVTISQVPGSVLDQFCSHLTSIGDVYYGTTNPGTTAYSSTDSTKKITSTAVYYITLYFPRGKHK